MARISFIANCIVWLAALLAPAQPLFALRCQCDHHSAEHVEHHHGALHHHGSPQRRQLADCSAGCCDVPAVSTGDSHCECDHHYPPQLSESAAYQLRAQVTVHWGELALSPRSLLLALQSTNASADARQIATAQEICAVLCRFLS